MEGRGQTPPPPPPRPPPPQEIDPCRPMGSPLCTILRRPLFVYVPQSLFSSFSSSFSNLIILRRQARRKKNAIFWSKFYQKCLKTPYWPVFFSKYWPKQRRKVKPKGLFSALGELGSQFDRAKKNSQFSLFLKYDPTSLEKILDSSIRDAKC